MKSQTACTEQYDGTRFGAIVAQVLANAEIRGYGGQVHQYTTNHTSPDTDLHEKMICSHYFSNTCPRPPPPSLNLSSWFTKPKPPEASAPTSINGKRLKVLHISDLHLDLRTSYVRRLK